MLELAQKYARALETTILAHRIEGNKITFVLESGPKLTMTQAELEAELEKLETAEKPKKGAKPK